MPESLLAETILAFLWAILISVFAIPSIIYLAYRKHLLDIPDNRKVHEGSIPRLGGVAVFASLMSALTIFGDFSNPNESIQQILAGCVLLFFTGMKDDVAPISAFKKFFVQLLAAGIIIFIGDIRITNLHGFLEIYEIDNIGISYAFSLIMIIAITNSINLIDGLNGLAGSLIVLMSTAFGILFFQLNSSLTILAFCLSGALIGFLRYNFFGGKIFMGDSGSLVSGFVISVLAIYFIESDISLDSRTPHLAIAILVIPLFDTIRVFIIRTLKGRSPFSPDKNHIHHRLLDLGFSQVSTVMTLLGLNLIAILVVLYTERLNINLFVLSISLIAFILSLIFKFFGSKEDE